MRKSIYTISIMIIISLFACAEKEENDCGECGGSLLEGYFYKTVEADDLANLAGINIITDLGACIRFKLDGEEFSEADVVPDCCCDL